jgi:hypothetical protein
MAEPSDARLWWRLLVARWAPWRGGRRLRRVLQQVSRSATVADAHAAERLAARVARVARLVPRSRCLDRALVLVECLRGAGAAAELRFGVRRGPGVLRAHAWVELDGRAIGEDAAALAALAPLVAPGLALADFD